MLFNNTKLSIATVVALGLVTINVAPSVAFGNTNNNDTENNISDNGNASANDTVDNNTNKLQNTQGLENDVEGGDAAAAAGDSNSNSKQRQSQGILDSGNS